MEVTVSYGEVLDKYSILDIKKDKLPGNPHVQNELDVLGPKVTTLFEDRVNKFYYHLLKMINLVIWDLSDFIRDHPGDIKACTDIIYHNDRRFRVKNKINRTSRIKEQKGYPLTKCLFLGHLESGDQLTNIGIVRILTTMYDQVTVVSKPLNVEFVKSLYLDDPCVQVQVRTIIYYTPLDLSDVPSDVKIIKTGVFDPRWEHNRDPHYDFFYTALGLDRSYRYLYNYIPRNPSVERELSDRIIPKDCKQYVFVHARENVHFNNIWSDDTFVFSVGYNMYPEGHKWYNQWNKEYKSLLLLSYCLMMEEADEIYVSDSSFFCLCTYLNLKPQAKLTVHNTRSGYSYHNPQQNWRYI